MTRRMLGGTQRPPCSWPPDADFALMAGYLGMDADVLQGVHGHYHPMFREATPKLRPGIDADGGDRGTAQIVDLSEVA
jgi:hypothetical protein